MVLNTTLFEWIFGFSRQSPTLDSLMIFGAEYLIFLTFLLVGILAFTGRAKEKKVLILLVVGMIIQLLLRKVVHIFYFEPRPFVTYQLIPLIKHAADASFPSGHTTIMAVVAFSYLFYKSKFTLIFLLLMLWVGLARIFVGVHYPLDILGGIVTGFTAVFLAWLIKNLIKSIYPSGFRASML